MALPKLRYDGYGQPIPPLADARQEALYERPFNVQQRRNVLALLEEKYRALLRRGTYAEVFLRFVVKDGVIMEEVRVGVEEMIRCERDG